MTQESNIDGFAHGSDSTVALRHADQTDAVTKDGAEVFGVDLEGYIVKGAEKVVEEQERGLGNLSILGIDSGGTTGRCYILEKKRMILVITYAVRFWTKWEDREEPTLCTKWPVSVPSPTQSRR